jgi:hypothetical protein
MRELSLQDKFLIPFFCKELGYTMKEAIEDRFIFNPLKNIVP